MGQFSFMKVIGRKYYKKRLWKITVTLVNLRRNGFRYVKQYERRSAIGCEWEYINGAVYEYSGAANIGGYGYK